MIELLEGSSSIAANFSWIEPARPYLLGLSIAVLAFAGYLKLKPIKQTISVHYTGHDVTHDPEMKAYYQRRAASGKTSYGHTKRSEI